MFVLHFVELPLPLEECVCFQLSVFFWGHGLGPLRLFGNGEKLCLLAVFIRHIGDVAGVVVLVNNTQILKTKSYLEVK